MPSLWLSYVPYHVARALVLHPHAHPIGREQRFEAVALFADVSGFTAISEALGATGKGGAEELTATLNSYFGPMIDLIHSYGGCIGKFGGDAMMVLFAYTPTSRVSVARRAIQCALDMQDRMARYAAIRTQAGTFSLTMKAGLATGPVFCTTVGDPAGRLEYIIAGDVLDRCAEAEHHARQGEVVIHDDLLASAGGVDVVDVIEKRDGFSCLARLRERAAGAPLAPLGKLAPQAIKTVAAYMHPIIAQRLSEGQASFINEHRKVAVLFVSFGSFDYDHDPDVGSRLQAYLSQVICLVHRYDGYLNKVDMGDKGSKYIVLFGAPIAHEDDAERALRCALELKALPDTPVRIGINIGFVYCGQVGSAVRQEYTVMGDAVNLAARLMQAAQPGQILVSDATHSMGIETFAWERGASIRAKGKSEPVGVHALVRLKRQVGLRLQEPEYALPMVGRQAELGRVQEKLARVQQSQGQIIGITAEAGMGKSRLAAEMIKLAAERGLTSYGGECLSHGVNTSYLVWHNLLRGFYGLDPSCTLDVKLHHLEAELAAVYANLVQRMPLLGRALNLSIPENELTRSMDAELRKASLEALLVECIRHRARQTPLLLVLEDCHWIDPLSNDLLEAVGRNIADVPVLMLVIYRPPETERIQPQVTRFGHFGEIRLAEFTPQEAERLIELKLARLFGSLAHVPTEFVERITERAQGNPFYIDEMISLIHDRGIDPADTQALQSFDLPDSLHSLIISRIDQLAEGAKTTLKVASAIGRLFRAGWLWGVYPKLGTPEQVKEQLASLSRLDITPLDKPEPELEYLFKHIVTREVAYESLALATRTMLHEQIGLFFERTYPQSLDRYVDLLAYHYSLSQNVDKQREYFYKAGAAAQAAYANDAAIDYFQRLLPLLPEEEQSSVMLELGRVWRLIGKWTEAETICRQALALAERTGDQGAQAQCERAIGTLLRFRGSYAEALAWLEQARDGFEALGDQGGVSEAERERGTVYWRQGDYSRALACHERCQQIATSLGDEQSIYRAVGNIGIVYWTQNDFSRALAYFEKGHQIATGLNDRLNICKAVNMMGNVHLDLGDYPRALACYTQYLHIALELGYRRGVGISVGNMAEIYLYQGDHAGALACFEQDLQIALELGDRLGVSLAVWHMARTHLAQGHCAEAEPLLRRAVALGRALDIPYELCDYLYTLADLYVRQAQYATAQPLNDEALSIAVELDHREVQFEAQVLAIRLRAALGQIDVPAAIGEFERLLNEWPDDAEQAAILYETWRLDRRQESHRQGAADLYRTLYTQTPNVEYKQRYEELTGQRLSDPPPLPPLPEVVTRNPVQREVLLVQVDALISELNAEAAA